jgi:hypothetical protein
LPPVEFCRGTRPSQAANSRPLRKPLGSVTVAAIAVAMIGPMPGILASRWLTGSQHLARQVRQARVALVPDDGDQPADIAQPLRRNDPELRQVRPQGIHQPRALPNQPLAPTVQQHSRLLLDRLHRHKRIVGRTTASQIAAASAASFLLRLR